MTHDEAVNLKTFGVYCTCGGYAGTAMHGRPNGEGHHLPYCPQEEVYMELYNTILEVKTNE